MGTTSFNGTPMNLTLRKEDRRAVDLLLDRSVKASGKGHGDGQSQPVYATADTSLGERVVRAHQLLQLLDWMPTPDPAADLVERTIRLVEEAARRPGAINPPLPNFLGSQRPVV